MDEFQYVPLESLHESKTNPRQHHDDAALEELTASVKEKGVLLPILVRPRPRDGAVRAQGQGFEIVSGARRFRAAKQAGLEQVPVRVKDFSDDEVREVQIIENLQRADVHPLDESAGYAALLEKNYEIETIAARVGKPKQYIYNRLKLNDLIPQAKKLAYSGKLPLGHCLLLARFQPTTQKQGLTWAMDGLRSDSVCSLSSLEDWVTRNVLLVLSSAGFDKEDPALVPKAGACTVCPKRTGANPMLFPEVKHKDICTDPQCFEHKVLTHIANAVKAQPDLRRITEDYYRQPGREKERDAALLPGEWTQAKKGSCEHTTQGIVVAGGGRGRILNICVEPKCKTHGRGGAGGERTRHAASPEEVKSRRQTQFQILYRERVLASVLDNAPKKLTDEDDVRLVAERLFAGLWFENKRRLLRLVGAEVKKQGVGKGNVGGYYDVDGAATKYLKGLDSAGLVRFILAGSLVANTDPKQYQDDGKGLQEVAKRLGVPTATIEKQVEAELKPKWAKADKARKTKAKREKK